MRDFLARGRISVSYFFYTIFRVSQQDKDEGFLAPSNWPLLPSFKSVHPVLLPFLQLKTRGKNTEGRGDMFHEVWGLAEAAAGVERDQMAY
jgi:hypothetical protein